MIVKCMEEGDLDQVTEIEKELFSLPWSFDGFVQGIQQQGSVFLVVKEQEEVLGYLGIYCSYDEGEITNVAVKPNFQGQGIGTLLLAKALQTAHDNRIRHLILEVRKSNDSAIHLYKKVGFEQIGLRHDFYEFPKEDGIVMKMNWDNWKEILC